MIKNPTFIDHAKLYDDQHVNRNFLCPEYYECLTDAAFQDLDLHCRDCPLVESKENTLISEIEKMLVEKD
jgi:hypothetical protein